MFASLELPISVIGGETFPVSSASFLVARTRLVGLLALPSLSNQVKALP